MASFDEVHRKDLHAADGRLRLGELWRIALREPLELAKLKPGAHDARVIVVQFVAMPGGKLEPATKDDRAILADWKERHLNTPPSWFGLPEGMLGPAQ
jgi:hypothetical protein